MKPALVSATLVLVAATLCGCGKGTSGDDDSFVPTVSEWSKTLAPLESYCAGLKDQAAKRGVKTLSEIELRIYSVWMFDEEVQNGGFSQYFYNQAGTLTPNTPAFLRDIGADRHADWLTEALAVFGTSGPSSDLLTRREQLEQLTPKAEEKLDQLSEMIQHRPRTLLELLSGHLRVLDPHRFE